MEFREGNYFYKIDRTQEIHIPIHFTQKIVAEAYGKVYFVDGNDIPACVEKHFECEYRDISEIDLTKDWLLNFGFVRDYKLEKLQNDEKEEYTFGDQRTEKFIRVCWHPVGGFTLSYRGTPLIKQRYVHKLQNIVYELIDEKLTIKEKEG